jgi:hypothetical protein
VEAKADRPDLPIWRCSLRQLGFVNYKAASAPGDLVRVECAYPDSTGSDLIDAFGEALEVRRFPAVVRFGGGSSARGDTMATGRSSRLAAGARLEAEVDPTRTTALAAEPQLAIGRDRPVSLGPNRFVRRRPNRESQGYLPRLQRYHSAAILTFKHSGDRVGGSVGNRP